MADTKDTIYVDVEEEITGIVSKVQKSSKDIVALVLPKRASVLQSTVNMKLLKRSSEQAGKKLVLITSESRILPLAGAVGVFVAANLTSKPYIPPSPTSGESIAPADSEDVSIDPDTPVSQLAPDAKFADETGEGLEIDNTQPKTPSAEDAKKSSGKKSKVPSFSRFRKKLIIGGVALLALIAFLVWAIVFAPSAQVIVRANTSELPLNIELRADKTVDQASPAERVVRASTAELEKEDSETVQASGEKNNGDKASGSVNMTAKSCAPDLNEEPANVPSGTGLSHNGNTYLTQSATSFSNLEGPDDSGNCNVYSSDEPTNIRAQSPGKNANTNNSSFTVAGRSDVSAQGSASGGNDDIVKVVSDTDIKKARERLNSKQNTTQDEMTEQLSSEGYTAIESSFEASDPDYDANPSVNSEADEVTVTSTTDYTMLGVNTEDIRRVIEEEVKNQENGENQSILSDGLNTSSFEVLSESEEIAIVRLSTTVVAGPDVDEEALKSQVEGKKDGEAEDILNGMSGFSDAEVSVSPFWVTKIPKASKVDFIVQQADGETIPE